MTGHHATPSEIAAFEQQLAHRDATPFGTDWNRLPRIPAAAYPFRGYTVSVWWNDGHGMCWHADDVPDQGSIEEVFPGIRLLTYSAD
jgi:hypothetical protein